MPAFGPDARHMPRKNSEVAAFNRQFVDGDEGPLVRTVMKLDSFKNASRHREISAARASGGDGTVARFRQVFQDRSFGKRPNPVP